MKLLLDENLSPRLVNRLNQLFPGLTHVREVGLKQADDQQIWDWARDNAFAIVTTDADLRWPSVMAGRLRSYISSSATSHCA